MELFVDDPIQYAIDTLTRVSSLIGQDKQVTFALIALQEFQDAQPCNCRVESLVNGTTRRHVCCIETAAKPSPLAPKG